MFSFKTLHASSLNTPQVTPKRRPPVTNNGTRLVAPAANDRYIRFQPNESLAPGLL